MGSFDSDHRSSAGKWFLSGPFRPVTNYITMDVLVDNKARLSNYRLSGVQLVLRDETTGVRTDLLPQLAHSFPFVFRDWEMIYARITPGDSYRIESYTDGPKDWIAFGEPFESGRLTPFTVAATQSGKLLCYCGLGLLMLALGLTFWKRKLAQFFSMTRYLLILLGSLGSALAVADPVITVTAEKSSAVYQPGEKIVWGRQGQWRYGCADKRGCVRVEKRRRCGHRPGQTLTFTNDAAHD